MRCRSAQEFGKECNCRIKMTIEEFQKKIKDIYYFKDSRRGIEGTFRWFVEEVGELAKAIRSKDRTALKEEFGDVLAWLVSLSSLCGIAVEEATKKYDLGCPKCKNIPCECPEI